MRRKSIAFVNSGPAGGKTTLIGQAIKAHFLEQPFFVPGLDFPPGDIAIVQTDRPIELQKPWLEALGLWEHPRLHLINFVDDRGLHKLTEPHDNEKYEVQDLDKLRKAISDRIKTLWPSTSTLILDLYDDFNTSSSNNGKRSGYHARANLQWAMDLDVALLGVCYPFKQTSARKADRVQDRMAGSLKGQASANWKITIIDAEELEKPYGLIEAKPGPGEGSPATIYVKRGRQEEGDYLGLFRLCSPDELDEEHSGTERNEVPGDVSRMAFFRALPNTFETAIALSMGKEYAASSRTLERWLRELVHEERIIALGRGRYRKA